VQKCVRALAPRDQKRGVHERFFYRLYFMHMNPVWEWFLSFANTPNPYVSFQDFVENHFCPI